MLHAAWVISVWLHILAATVWLGGMAFLVLVVVPWLRAGERSNAMAMLRETGLRFRTVGWGCFVVLVATGTFNLYMRGVRPGNLIDPLWLSGDFGRAFAIKAGLFTVVLVISAVHDFWLGPRATHLLEKDPASPEGQKLRRWVSLIGRANALLALAIVFFAVVLVRGWP